MQARFDTALAPLLPKTLQPIGLAVSGGGDSMALLHFAAGSALISNERLLAFTVDHGLRTEAADEAAFVAEACDRYGITHRTLKWREPNASQARARMARHRLIASALKEAGGTMLLTGHTIGDNAESFLIRARAGSGWYGLAGMSALASSPVWPEGEDVFIARPMLALQRDEIRGWLRMQGEDWYEDPSNENTHYERVRMRRLLASAPNFAPRIARIQQNLSELRGARDRAIAGWLVCAEQSYEGLMLPWPRLIGQEALSQALSYACMAVAGADRLARTARSLAAAARLRQSCAGLTLTLGGAVIRQTGEKLVIQRESNRPEMESPLNSLGRLRHICAGLTGAVPA